MDITHVSLQWLVLPLGRDGCGSNARLPTQVGPRPDLGPLRARRDHALQWCANRAYLPGQSCQSAPSGARGYRHSSRRATIADTIGADASAQYASGPRLWTDRDLRPLYCLRMACGME